MVQKLAEYSRLKPNWRSLYPHWKQNYWIFCQILRYTTIVCIVRRIHVPPLMDIGVTAPNKKHYEAKCHEQWLPKNRRAMVTKHLRLPWSLNSPTQLSLLRAYRLQTADLTSCYEPTLHIRILCAHPGRNPGPCISVVSDCHPLASFCTNGTSWPCAHCAAGKCESSFVNCWSFTRSMVFQFDQNCWAAERVDRQARSPLNFCQVPVSAGRADYLKTLWYKPPDKMTSGQSLFLSRL